MKKKEKTKEKIVNDSVIRTLNEQG